METLCTLDLILKKIKRDRVDVKFTKKKKMNRKKKHKVHLKTKNNEKAPMT
jgi:hypothetical protein